MEREAEFAWWKRGRKAGRMWKCSAHGGVSRQGAEVLRGEEVIFLREMEGDILN